MTYNGSEYFYLTYLQDDVTGLADASGATVVSYTYDTWGKLISTTSSMATALGVKNPFRYRGYRYDTETGLYYLQSLYYNPESGRFINADDAEVLNLTNGQLISPNLFTYCNNNPVNDTDPSGYISIWSVIDILISVVSLFAPVRLYKWIFAAYWGCRFIDEVYSYRFMKGEWWRQRYRNFKMWYNAWQQYKVIQISNIKYDRVVIIFIAAVTSFPKDFVAKWQER